MATSMGSRLRALREARGWSLAQAASRLRVTRGAIAHYEHDRRMPGSDRLKRIVKVYKTSVSHLYGERAATSS